eukprot:SAG31_NODE_560_length_14088_cov_10.467010_4_plen_103_part_00
MQRLTNQRIVQMNILVVGGCFGDRPVDVTTSNNWKSSDCCVVTSGNQTWEKLVTHVQIRSDDVFGVVVVGPRTVVTACGKAKKRAEALSTGKQCVKEVTYLP